MPEKRNDFCDVYGQLREQFAAELGEKQSTYGLAGRSVREEIVRCVWFGSHFPSEGLTTDDGRRMEVLSPGWWNVEGGPDFIRAEFVLEGTGRVVGDVEVHTLASSWHAHGHDRQPEYNDVALHVVMWNDRDEPCVLAQDGKQIPQLTLSNVIEEDLEELVEVIGPEDETPLYARAAVEGRYCGPAYASGEIGPEWLGGLLDAAGDHRLFTRAATCAGLFENHPREQLLYERVAEALGYKNNRMPFMQLAGLLPAHLLRERVPADATFEEKSLILEAALFSVAGFLAAVEPEDADPETVAHVGELRRRWRDFGAPPTQVNLGPEHWHFAGTRPANYPTRRIAALARLYAGHLHGGLFSHLLRRVAGVSRPTGRGRLDTALRGALLDTFLQLDHPYWSHRYGFGAKKFGNPRALVGRQRATSILVDVLLPMLLAHARAEGDTETAERMQLVWQRMPPRPGNAVTRRMNQVIFGSREEARKVVGSTRRQQGLHQIYRDCCRTSRGCERCIVYLAHTSGRTFDGQ